MGDLRNFKISQGQQSVRVINWVGNVPDGELFLSSVSWGTSLRESPDSRHTLRALTVFFNTWNVIMLETGRYFLTGWDALQVTCPQDLELLCGYKKYVPDVSS